MTSNTLIRLTTVVVVVGVAAIAAVVSFWHMKELALSVGEQWRSYLIPLTIDGLVVSASMVLVTRKREGRKPSELAWGALVGGIVASIAANVLDAKPGITPVLMAGWAPLAFAVCFELLLQQRRSEATDEHPTEATEQTHTPHTERGHTKTTVVSPSITTTFEATDTKSTEAIEQAHTELLEQQSKVMIPSVTTTPSIQPLPARESGGPREPIASTPSVTPVVLPEQTHRGMPGLSESSRDQSRITTEPAGIATPEVVRPVPKLQPVRELSHLRRSSSQHPSAEPRKGGPPRKVTAEDVKRCLDRGLRPHQLPGVLKVSKPTIDRRLRELRESS